METEKLYYENPFLRQFAATVLSCEAGKDGYLVTLDRTAFYPEGGGQPADHGTLNGVAVTDVHEKNGVIFHTCQEKVEIGAVVTGQIDWERRFDHMQQHSGEHILSGILCELYHCDNVGFHLGADTVTIDYNTDISWEQAMAAEQRANETIWADTPVKILFPTPEELEAIHYRSKKELSGQVRIVAFPGADCCACCGTHVLSAGQVGIIKVLSCQKFRSGVRMEILCGKRAWRYLGQVYDQARAVGQHLSVKPVDVGGAVEREIAYRLHDDEDGSFAVRSVCTRTCPVAVELSVRARYLTPIGSLLSQEESGPVFSCTARACGSVDETARGEAA